MPEGEGHSLATWLDQRAHPNLLQVADPQDTYIRNGTFAPPRAAYTVGQLVERHLRRRPDRFARIVADMSWAHPFISQSFVSQLVDFEAAVTRWVRSFPQVGMCMYDLGLFGGETVIPVIRAHPKVWMSDMLVENPYYLKTDATSSTS